MGMGDHPDGDLHRNGGSAAGEREPGAGFQLFERHRDDRGDGQAAVLTQFPGGQKRAQAGFEGVEIALTGGAGVGGRGRWVGVAIDGGDRVGGVAHAGATEFGEQDFQIGTGFGVKASFDGAHPVGHLRGQG